MDRLSPGRRRILRRAAAPAVALPRVHPVLRPILACRGVRGPADLDYSLSALHGFASLPGIHAAVAFLGDALRDDRRLLVVGDYDADGATSCCVAVRALASMGARHVSYMVPNRVRDGYGLSPAVVSQVDPGTDVIITVDNGVASVDGTGAARERGIDVVITDHHLPGAQLPDAVAIVNPNLPGSAFPSPHLAGVGVIFYVLMALRAHLRGLGWFRGRGIPEPNLADYLDLVALGTVADVVPLDRNNRILVAQGLKRIRAGRCCAGLAALIRLSGRDPARLSAADLAFGAAPRLNAAGRMSDMSVGVECLLAEPDRAEALARQLDALNAERRQVEADMQATALEAVDKALGAAPEALPALCLFDPQWHEGVVGILAARLKDRYHRPAVAFAPGGDGLLKGSARSVAGVHIRDVLDAVATRHPHLLSRFGGHAMAAGLSLAEDHFDAFHEAFLSELTGLYPNAGTAGVLLSDGRVPATHLTLELAEAIAGAGPWGQGFEEPVFDDVFQVNSVRPVGEGHLKLGLGLEGRPAISAIAFKGSAEEAPVAGERVRVAYRLTVNDYLGYQTPELVVTYLSRA